MTAQVNVRQRTHHQVFIPGFLSYGEDPLTYWAITARLPDVLRQLRDAAQTTDTLVIYRPSFGRRGRPGENSSDQTPRAEFGEFDVIIGTPSAVYLVESKWTSSLEAKQSSFTLRPEQLHRHKVFRWHLGEWRQQRPASWVEFHQYNDLAFRSLFPGNKLAPPGSALATNLEFVLDRLASCGSSIQDVLLFITDSDDTPPAMDRLASFTLVCIRFEALTGTGYFSM
jgi:hypothetical protein